MGTWVMIADDGAEGGHAAAERMLLNSCVAAWGDLFGAETTLNMPEPCDHVFFFMKGIGVLAKATFDASWAFPSNQIFGQKHQGEFCRRITDLHVRLDKPVTCEEIEAEAGKGFIPLSTLFMIRSPQISAFLLGCFDGDEFPDQAHGVASAHR
jgi:hypothetical protein